MVRVMLLSLVFGPDTVSTANMMTQLAHGLSRMGHQVTVLTSMPHYNPSQEVLRNPRYRSGPLSLFTESTEDGVRVLRVYMPLKGQRVWRRALDYLWFHFATTAVAVAMVRRQDIVLVTSPPITLGLSGYLLAALFRAKLVYDVRELWPDVPVRMGLLKNRLLVRVAYGIEGFVYRNSAAITTIARCFNESLVRRGVPRGKLHFTPNFVDTDWMQPRPKLNSFARETGLVDKFVVLYAGNIGLTQGLEILVEIGRGLADDRDVMIVVIGDGAGRSQLIRAVEKSGLTNIKLLPFQPYDRVPDAYASADVCISPMRYGFSYDTVPSKIYTVMAAGRAIIAACEPDTEAARLVVESESGLVVEPESAGEMLAAISKLRFAPGLARAMGDNGRRWIVDNYGKDTVVAAYDRVISSIAGDSRPC